MSYCRDEGKDKIIFVTKEDYEKPSTALVTTKNDDDDDEEPGLILKDGSINWNCPCLGGMAAGPCGVPFRDAFSCFHYSEAAPKGSDCFEAFKKMQDCMSEYPELYPRDEDASKDPLANAPDKPEEKLESSSSEPATGTDSSSEPATATDSGSEAAPTESAPEEKIVSEDSSSEPATEADSSLEVIPSESTELAPDKQEEKIVSENSSSEPAVEADSSSEVIQPEAASTEQNTVEEKS